MCWAYPRSPPAWHLHRKTLIPRIFSKGRRVRARVRGVCGDLSALERDCEFLWRDRDLYPEITFRYSPCPTRRTTTNFAHHTLGDAPRHFTIYYPVLPVDRARRLHTPYHCLEAAHDHQGRQTLPSTLECSKPPGCDQANVVHRPSLPSDHQQLSQQKTSIVKCRVPKFQLVHSLDTTSLNGVSASTVHVTFFGRLLT